MKPFESFGSSLEFGRGEVEGGYLALDELFGQEFDDVGFGRGSLFWALADQRRENPQLFSVDRSHFWEISCSKLLEPYLPFLIFDGYPSEGFPIKNDDGIVAMLKPRLVDLHPLDRYLISVNGRRWVRDDRDLGFVPLITSDDIIGRPDVQMVSPSGDMSIIGQVFGGWNATISRIGADWSVTADGFGPAVSSWAGWGCQPNPFSKSRDDYRHEYFAASNGLAEGFGEPGELARLLWFATKNRLSGFGFNLQRPFLRKDARGHDTLLPGNTWENTWRVDFGDLTKDAYLKFASEYDQLMLDI